MESAPYRWLIAGTLPQVNKTCYLLNESNLNKILKKFFEIESLSGDNKEFINFLHSNVKLLEYQF